QELPRRHGCATRGDHRTKSCRGGQPAYRPEEHRPRISAGHFLTEERIGVAPKPVRKGREPAFYFCGSRRERPHPEDKDARTHPWRQPRTDRVWTGWAVREWWAGHVLGRTGPLRTSLPQPAKTAKVERCRLVPCDAARGSRPLASPLAQPARRAAPRGSPNSKQTRNR